MSGADSAAGLVENKDKFDRENVFMVVSNNKSYTLCAESEEKMHAWVAHLRKAAQLSIRDLYDIKAELGTGTFSVVKLGVLKRTGIAYALKVIEKKTLNANRDELLTEITILKKVKHKNVICLRQIFETKYKLYLIMDVLNGGELFDRIVERGMFSERDASDLIRAVLTAVAYLHDMNIVHRDLKPENLLYTDPSPDAEIKIADFGLSTFIEEDSSLTVACGTPGYVAPEVLEMKGYGKVVDCWSTGVILYILLCGFPPFYADTDEAMFEMIKHSELEFPSPEWDSISESAKSAVRDLLTKDPSKRPTALESLKHTWIMGESASAVANEALYNSLKELNAARKFRNGVGKLINVQRVQAILTKSPWKTVRAS